MARDWNDETATLTALEARVASIAPENLAPIPIAMSLERQDDGQLMWRVDVHIKIYRVTEYDVEGWGISPPDALRRAYLALNSEARLRGLANAANVQFGIAV